MFHAAGPRRERAFGWLGLLLTGVFAAGALQHAVRVGIGAADRGDAAACALAAVFALIIVVLAIGSAVYQVCRLGYLTRIARSEQHRYRGVKELLQREVRPTVTVCIPSYKEDAAVIRHALLSAALQDYPGRRVVLLVDDPPDPASEADRVLLDDARGLVVDVRRLVDGPHRRTDVFSAALRTGVANGEPDDAWRARLLREIRLAREWFATRDAHEPARTHTDRLFHDQVLRAWVGDLARMERVVRVDKPCGSALVAWADWLRSIFDVELTFFERKRWDNLPHEPNKAMNVNAYLSLVGGRFVVRPSRRGRATLAPTTAQEPDVVVPDADYVATLDADSIIHPHYVVRLIAQLELPENRDVAVIQTPYSAIPDAPTTVERVAGATTDLQYVVHQGFTRWNATFWVGANAVLRMAAIRAIARRDVERGWPIKRYIQDRTVIEDTESSIDLAAAGWRLHNVPERLSWSATPPDFGALVIQRRRWANGGIIIAGELRRLRRVRARELALRGHYLLSPFCSNLAVVLLLLGPFGAAFDTWWLPLCAVPYFGVQLRDLRQLGYRRSDILRVWALNLLLVPVNLAGVLRSIHQACTARKTPFARTPKVENRTAVPAAYIVVPVMLAVSTCITSAMHLARGYVLEALFGAITAGLLVYALAVFVGVDAMRQDVLRVLGVAGRDADEEPERVAA